MRQFYKQTVRMQSQVATSLAPTYPWPTKCNICLNRVLCSATQPPKEHSRNRGWVILRFRHAFCWCTVLPLTAGCTRPKCRELLGGKRLRGSCTGSQKSGYCTVKGRYASAKCGWQFRQLPVLMWCVALMEGWMDGVSLRGATPWDTGTPALLAYRPGQLGCCCCCCVVLCCVLCCVVLCCVVLCCVVLCCVVLCCVVLCCVVLCCVVLCCVVLCCVVLCCVVLCCVVLCCVVLCCVVLCCVVLCCVVLCCVVLCCVVLCCVVLCCVVLCCVVLCCVVLCCVVLCCVVLCCSLMQDTCGGVPIGLADPQVS